MNARERRFHWVWVGAVLVVALVIVVRATYDALASPVGPTPLWVAQDDSEELARARRYNRRLERILHREVSRAERHERSLIRSRRAMRRALGTSPIGNHWLEVAFECIHRHEGSWTDPNLPYFGGLQMNLDFQRAYGRPFLRHFGPANEWPKSVQMAVAIEAWIGRGFQPWPITRRMCGL